MLTHLLRVRRNFDTSDDLDGAFFSPEVFALPDVECRASPNGVATHPPDLRSFQVVVR